MTRTPDNTTPHIPETAASRQDGGIAGMFGRIALGYDRANRLLSCGLDIWWRRQLVRAAAQSLPSGREQVVLDLAAGTLDVSLALYRAMPENTVLAVDFCEPMLRAGSGKLRRAGSLAEQAITRLAGDAFHLPLADASVQAVTVAFGLRNMVPHQDALAEALRVLAPGGTLFILEFGSAKSPLWGGLYNWYLTRVLPFLGGHIAGDPQAYAYLARTVAEFPTAPELGDELRRAGFQDVSWRALHGGIVYLHRGTK